MAEEPGLNRKRDFKMKRISVVTASAALMAATFLLGAFFGPALLGLAEDATCQGLLNKYHVAADNKLKREGEEYSALVSYAKNSAKSLAQFCRGLPGHDRRYCAQLL